jgi:hypothetical protein
VTPPAVGFGRRPHMDSAGEFPRRWAGAEIAWSLMDNRMRSEWALFRVFRICGGWPDMGHNAFTWASPVEVVEGVTRERRGSAHR